MSLKKLQELSGVDADGQFGPNTFKAASKYLGITDHNCAVHFWAQCAHESTGFTRFEENLNYSTQGLRNTFDEYFKDNSIAEEYARQPEKIANRVYANRMGNGDEASGDGWTFKGRGALQLTGRNNYTAFADSIGDMCIIEEPKIVAQEHSFTSAMWYFDENNLWKICKGELSDSVIEKLTRKINGGLNGIDDRKELTAKYSTYKL